MDNKQILDAIKKLKEVSPKRNFKQTYDLVINLKGIDLKKPEQNIDLFLTLGHLKGKMPTVCALIDKELGNQKAAFDFTIMKEEFPRYKDKKELKKLANYDYFVAQANIMADIASVFGKFLGPKGKMPNPKAGCVVPATATVSGIKDRLAKVAHLKTKNEAVVRTSVGFEDMPESEIADNVLKVYNEVVHHLPQEAANIKSTLLKFSMGPSVEIKEDKIVARIKDKTKTKKQVKEEKKEAKEEAKELKKEEKKAPKKVKKEE